VDTPEAGHGRTVDLSMAVKDVLERLRTARQEKALADGVDVPAWVFATDAGTPFDHAKAGKVFKRILKAAGLPGHYSPHSLRHTYASLLLQMGQSPAYVQRQLGHASIKLTVDTYGRWLPMGTRLPWTALTRASSRRTTRLVAG
jgi:integrase